MSALLGGTASFLGGGLSRRLPSTAVAGASQLVAFVTLASVMVVAQRLEPLGPWTPWAALAGACLAVALTSLYRALSIGTMGIVAPIASLAVLIPLAWVTVARQSPPAIAQVFGVALALLGICLVTGWRRHAATPWKAVGLASVAAVAFGLMMVSLGIGASQTPLMTALIMKATSAVTLLLLVRGAVLRAGWQRSDVPTVLTLGAIVVGADVALVLATQSSVTVASVLASMHPIATVVLARVVLGERLGRAQQIGLVAAFSGVVLVTVGATGLP